jgi:putative PIN family toxin of toxin-antitoxin system
MTTLTVVFDTNILFSGTGWRGSPFYCLKLAREQKVSLVLCREILTEYHSKLQTKLGMSESQATRAAAEILSFSSMVEISNALHVISDDPDDDKVLKCAVIGNASHIVSGDHHLLDIKEYKKIQIVPASYFLELTRAPEY